MLRKGKSHITCHFLVLIIFVSLIYEKMRIHFIGIFADAPEAKNHFEVFMYLKVYTLALCGT